MGELGHAEWVPPHPQQGDSTLWWGARGKGKRGRWIRASQAKKIGSRIFTRDLHQGGRRASQVGFLSEFFVVFLIVCLFCQRCVRSFFKFLFVFVLPGGTGRRCQGGRSPPASTWGSRSPSTPGSTRSSAPASSPPGSRACCTCPSPSRRWSNTGSRSVLELRTFSTSTPRPSGQVEECLDLDFCYQLFADDSLHKILPTVRQCFLSDERWLRSKSILAHHLFAARPIFMNQLD